MAQKMLIDATHAEETRVVVVDGNKVEEFDFETASRRQLAGNIYLAKVTRVEPSLQAAFVDYGGNRHGFLAFNEIHPDYYQIPAADRAALLEEERNLASDGDEDETDAKSASSAKGGSGGRKVQRSSSRRKSGAQAERTQAADQVESQTIAGMDIVEPEGTDDAQPVEGFGTEAAQPDAAAEPVAEAVAELAAEAVAEPVADSAPEGDEPYRAADHATEIDDRIEAVSDGDPVEEERPRRKPRMRRYKIQEVIKVRQIMLVQVVKEERGNKGAALTTYLSLAGRYCVLMPNTARGGGISRKITNATDRQKLKAIANEIKVPEGAGLIVRTAGAQRTKAEIKRDYEYLLRLWEQIRELTLKSIAPTPIYAEGDLIKRTIRDLYSKSIDEVLVEGEAGYRTAKDFMKMIMPSHAKNVKLYADSQPLFARYQVESYLSAMFNPTVQLPSGGYIVIGITEALVAIDINSGRATREGSIEDTAVKTNLEAAAEIARQLRLRDLAGLIVIDFIDMEERKNNAAVEKMLKDKLKNDRARIQVGRISGFGLLEMSRQRLRPGMLEATTQPCPHCHGTGLIRSDDSVGLTVLRQIEEEGTRGRSREVLVRAPAAVVNFIINSKREHLAQIEARFDMAVRLEADPRMVSPDFEIEKFKTATRVPVRASEVVSISTTAMPDLDEDEDDIVEVEDDRLEAEAQASSDPSGQAGDDDGEGQPRKKRRRRRRRRGGGQNGGDDAQSAANDAGDEAGAASEAGDAPETPAPAVEPEAADATAEAAAPAEVQAEAPPAKPKRTRTRKAPAKAKPEAPAPDAEASASAEDAAEAPVKKPARSRRKPAKAKAPAIDPATAPDSAEVAAAQDAPEQAQAEDVAATPVPVSADAVIAAEPAVESVDPAPVAQADAPQTGPVEAGPVEAGPVEAGPVETVAPDAGAPAPAEDSATPVAQAAPAEESVASVVGAVTAEDSATPAAETSDAETSAPAADSTTESAAPKEPKRRGWWSLRN